MRKKWTYVAIVSMMLGVAPVSPDVLTQTSRQDFLNCVVQRLNC